MFDQYDDEKKTQGFIDSRYLLRKDDLSLDGKIGYGPGVTVYNGTYKKDISVSVKKYDIIALSAAEDALYKEANMILKLSHPNIVKFLGLCTEQMLAIVFEKSGILMCGEKVYSLQEMLRVFGNAFPNNLRINSIHQICQGLYYIHTKDITHNDIKAANISVHANNNQILYKLCNFGEARDDLVDIATSSQRLADKRFTDNLKSSIPFMAPECLQSNIHSKMSDIFSFGMMMYEILNPDKTYPWESEFNDFNPEGIEEKVLKGDRPLIEEISFIDSKKKQKCDSCIDFSEKCKYETYVEIMKACWQQEPDDRPKVMELLCKISFLCILQDKNLFISSDSNTGLDKQFCEEMLSSEFNLILKFLSVMSQMNKKSVEELHAKLSQIIEDTKNGKFKIDVSNMTADTTRFIGGTSGLAAGIGGLFLLFNPMLVPVFGAAVAGGALAATVTTISGAIGKVAVKYQDIEHDKQTIKQFEINCKENSLSNTFYQFVTSFHDVVKNPTITLENVTCTSGYHMQDKDLSTFEVVEKNSSVDLETKILNFLIGILIKTQRYNKVTFSIPSNNLISMDDIKTLTPVALNIKDLKYVCVPVTFEATKDITIDVIPDILDVSSEPLYEVASEISAVVGQEVIKGVFAAAGGVLSLRTMFRSFSDIVSTSSSLYNGSSNVLCDLYSCYQDILNTLWKIYEFKDNNS